MAGGRGAGAAGLPPVRTSPGPRGPSGGALIIRTASVPVPVPPPWEPPRDRRTVQTPRSSGGPGRRTGTGAGKWAGTGTGAQAGAGARAGPGSGGAILVQTASVHAAAGICCGPSGRTAKRSSVTIICIHIYDRTPLGGAYGPGRCSCKLAPIVLEQCCSQV